jgi:signal transduction histidine kinase/DNA-binding response OmpR family regulator
MMIFCGCLFFLSTQGLSGKNNGFKYIENYSFKESGYCPQNWMVAQDSHGLIYVANTTALLVFDGASWQIIPLPGHMVLSLAIDDNGTIYIGGKGEMGYFFPDSQGTLKYESLMNHLDENQKNISLIFRIYCLEDKVYFSNPQLVLRWDKKKKRMDQWTFAASYLRVIKCGEKLYLLNNRDRMPMKDDLLKTVPFGKGFDEKFITMMVTDDKERILIGTFYNGLYLYDGNTVIPFPTEVDDYLKENFLFMGIRLSSPVTESREYALATMRGGLVIINAHGQLKYIFNEATGLQNNFVRYVFEDFQGNLWLALDIGISKIEYSSPFDYYDRRYNLPGTVSSVTSHPSGFYACTTKGLFFLSTSTANKTNKFQPFQGISNMCVSVIPFEDSVLMAGDDGVFKVQNHTQQQLLDIPSRTIYQSQRDPHRLWVGTQFEGLISLYFNTKTSQWQVEKRFTNIQEEAGTIIEDETGTVWLGLFLRGVIKIDFPTDIHHPVITRYSAQHGLPNTYIQVFKFAGHLMFTTAKGIFRFDQTNNRFVPDRTLGNNFAGGGKPVFYIVEDRNKHVWLNSTGCTIRGIPQPDGSFIFQTIPFFRASYGGMRTIYPDPNENAIWLGSVDNLVRFNTKGNKNEQLKFYTLIRNVNSMDKKRLVFGGYKTYNDNNSTTIYPTRLEYQYRNLHFEFAAPFFEDESHITYQYLMEGHDKHWSTWDSKTYADYPDLDPGVYTFRVRAKNIYQNISQEDAFRFTVLPPWYRTWWAFLGYALVFFLVVYLAVKWRSRKLEQEKLNLEQIIKERTKEIHEKNQQLEEMDKIKSRFFANISHEFRTPLTLIMGPLEQILSTYSDKELKKTARIMLRNSQRLLNLVNQLLELAKLDSGKMKLNPSRKNIVPVLKTIVASFESLALQKKLELTVHSREEDITLYFDSDKLEKIIGNLLSNAVKFTPPGGKITLSLKKNLASDKHFPSGSVDISVTDTGIGIRESQREHLFERFYQVGDSHEHQQKGSGIGLALTKELVTLHQGEILVRSSTGEEGKTSGTEFIVRLPLGTEHLKPKEVAPPSEEITAMSTLAPLSAPQDIGRIPDQYIDSIEPEEETIEEPIIHKTIQEEKNIILVVEDSTDMRNYIRGALGSVYRVMEAEDGKQGIEKAKKNIPDLIISDIMMPGADGYELCSKLKKDMNTSHIPIILLTAKASEESVIQGLETGADDYITKPFNTNILFARIKNLIDLRQQLQLKRKRQMALQPEEITVSSIEEKFYKELQYTIEKNLSDPEFNVDQLHKKLYMGRTSLYRKILALTGETPTQFIRSYRLQRAAQLFKANFGNVTEVAFAVGFSNTAYFSKCFKEKFHQSPSYYHASEARDR